MVLLFALLAGCPKTVGKPVRNLAAGETVSSAAQAYRLVPTEPGWRAATPGTYVKDSELELMGPGGTPLVVVQHEATYNGNLDTLVDGRRNMRSPKCNMTEYGERRFFIPDSDYQVASITRIVCREDGRSKLIMTLAVATGVGAVELIGMSTDAQRDEPRLEALLRSIRIPHEERQP